MKKKVTDKFTRYPENKYFCYLLEDLIEDKPGINLDNPYDFILLMSEAAFCFFDHIKLRVHADYYSTPQQEIEFRKITTLKEAEFFFLIMESFFKTEFEKYIPDIFHCFKLSIKKETIALTQAKGKAGLDLLLYQKGMDKSTRVLKMHKTDQTGQQNKVQDKFYIQCDKIFLRMINNNNKEPKLAEVISEGIRMHSNLLSKTNRNNLKDPETKYKTKKQIQDQYRRWRKRKKISVSMHRNAFI